MPTVKRAWRPMFVTKVAKRWSNWLSTKVGSRLVPPDLREAGGKKPAPLVQAQRYAAHRKRFRLGRSHITNPDVFNDAERAADRTARHAQRQFHSRGFQTMLGVVGLVSKSARADVVNQYRGILRTRGSLSMIARRDRTQHQQTPSVLNKRAFTERLRGALRARKRDYTIGMVDLDDFKYNVNSAFGHVVGDAVLDLYSRRFNAFILEMGGAFGRDKKGNVGLASRVGGEEFQFYVPISPIQFRGEVNAFRARFINETRSSAFMKGSKARLSPTSPKWRRGVSFTVALAGRGEESRRRAINLPNLFTALSTALNTAKTVEGKGQSVILEGAW